MTAAVNVQGPAVTPDCVEQGVWSEQVESLDVRLGSGGDILRADATGADVQQVLINEGVVIDTPVVCSNVAPPAARLRLRCWLDSDSQAGMGVTTIGALTHRTIGRARARGETEVCAAGCFRGGPRAVCGRPAKHHP